MLITMYSINCTFCSRGMSFFLYPKSLTHVNFKLRDHCSALVVRRILVFFQKKIIITCKEEKCGKQFTLAYNYKLHVKHHQQRFVFICQICGKGFMNQNHHENHTFTHLKEKPFLCVVCSKRFLTKSNLQHHRATCRNIDNCHQCMLCGKKFLTEFNLLRHQCQAHTSYFSSK